MSREDHVHVPLGPCWCGSQCHHGGYHSDPTDLRFDDAAGKAFCKRTGAWVQGAYTEHSPKGRAAYERRMTLSQRRSWNHRYPDTTGTRGATKARGKRGYRWLILRDGRRVQVAVQANPGYRMGRSSSKADDLSTTRRNRLTERGQAPTPQRSRRGVVSSSTTRARKFLGLGKRDGRGNLHDPATGRFTKKG